MPIEVQNRKGALESPGLPLVCKMKGSAGGSDQNELERTAQALKVYENNLRKLENLRSRVQKLVPGVNLK